MPRSIGPTSLGVLGFVGGWLAASPALALGLPLAVLGWRHWTTVAAVPVRRRRTADQTLALVDELIQALKAGRSLAQSLRSTAAGPTSGHGSTSGELGLILTRLQAALDAGYGLEMALAQAAARSSADPGVGLTLNTLWVLVQRGGPAVPALERLNDTLRSAQWVEQETTVQASQATASALALAGLPALFVAALVALDHRLARFYGFEPLGAVCLITSGLLSYLGWWWMHRIIWRPAPDGGPSRAPAPHRPPWLGVALVALAALPLLWVSPVASVVMVVSGAAAVRLRDKRRHQHHQSSLLAAAPRALDLCAVVLGAGGTIPDAVGALAASGPDPIRISAAAAVERTMAGHRLDQALRWLQADLGPGLQPLTGTLLLANEQGGPVGLTLGRLASEASAGRRRLGEIRARRLPVMLLVPLVVCSLPAVLIGAVAPLAVVALRHIQL